VSPAGVGSWELVSLAPATYNSNELHESQVGRPKKVKAGVFDAAQRKYGG